MMVSGIFLSYPASKHLKQKMLRQSKTANFKANTHTYGVEQ
jgi:hypothetical protein